MPAAAANKRDCCSGPLALYLSNSVRDIGNRSCWHFQRTVDADSLVLVVAHGQFGCIFAGIKQIVKLVLVSDDAEEEAENQDEAEEEKVEEWDDEEDEI